MVVQLEKPAFLHSDNARTFEELDAVASYRNRPDYAPEVFAILKRLMASDKPVLDIGCGLGFIARPLASFSRVDAVDISPGMIAAGKRMPGGDSARLNWIAKRFEEADLHGPYGLITAAESLHWMDWKSVLPKCGTLLAPGSMLAIIDHRPLPLPWQTELGDLIAEYSTNPTYRPYDSAHELTARGLFEEVGRVKTSPDIFVQSIDEYIDSFHARAAFSRREMGDKVHEFDNAIRLLIAGYGVREVAINRVTEIVWGTPT